MGFETQEEAERWAEAMEFKADQQREEKLFQKHVILGLAKPWVWVQPNNDADLIARLIEARDYAVHERERENLCGVAAHRLGILLRERDHG